MQWHPLDEAPAERNELGNRLLFARSGLDWWVEGGNRWELLHNGLYGVWAQQRSLIREGSVISEEVGLGFNWSEVV